MDKLIKQFFYLFSLCFFVQAGGEQPSKLKSESLKQDLVTQFILEADLQNAEGPKPISKEKPLTTWQKIKIALLGAPIDKFDLGISPIDSFKKKELVFGFDSSIFKREKLLFQDFVACELNLLKGSDFDKSQSLLEKLNRTSTIWGYKALAYALRYPETDKEVLLSKQNLAKALLNHTNLYALVEKSLKQLADGEDFFIGLFNQESVFTSRLKDFYFDKNLKFDLIKNLNKNTLSLTTWGLLDICFFKTNILELAWDHMSSKFFMEHMGGSEITKKSSTLLFKGIKTVGEKIGLRERLSDISTDYNGEVLTDKQIELAMNVRTALSFFTLILKTPLIADKLNFEKSLIDALKLRLRYVKTTIEALNNLSIITETNPKLVSHIKGIDQLINFTKQLENPKSSLYKLNEIVKDFDNKNHVSDFIFRGKILAAYRLLQEIKDEFIPALQIAGQFDVAINIVKLIKEYENKYNKYNFVSLKMIRSPHA